MQYKIIEKRDHCELVDRVNELMEKGWKPQGGVGILTLNDNRYWYIQAMIKDS